MLKPILSILFAVIFLAGADVAQAKKKDKPSKKATQWYVKTTLTVRDPASDAWVHDTRSGVFGQLTASDLGFDVYDTPSWAAVTQSRAAITFEQGDEWGERAGQYLSDYHPTGLNNDYWTFTVYSSLDATEVTLNWDGLFVVDQDPNGAFVEQKDQAHKLLNKLHLVDLQTGEVFKATRRVRGKPTMNSHTFSMAGQTRREFRWVLGDVTDAHLEPTMQAKHKKHRLTDSPSALENRQIQALQSAPPPSGKFGTPPEGGAQ